MSKIVLTYRGESPMLGSSIRSSLGCDISARLMASICCSPPESVPAICPARSRRMANRPYSRSSVASISFLSLRVYAPRRRFSSTVSSWKIRRPSGTCAIPMETSVCAGTDVMSFPRNETRPACLGISPATACIIVVFPAPFAPMRATISPSFTSKETPRIALISP